MSRLRPHLTLSGIAILMAALTIPAHATDVLLGFGSLPTAQGWSYSNSGTVVPEATGWSVSGGVLAVNTMPYLTNTTGTGVTSFYQISGIVNNFEPIIIEMRARILEWEGDGSSSVVSCFGLGFTHGSTLWAMGITTSPNRIYSITGATLSTTIDNTQFHDYRIEWDPPSTIRYYVDNVLISSVPGGLSQALNRIYFGDATGASNTHAEITYYRFRQGAATSTASPTWGRLKSVYR